MESFEAASLFPPAKDFGSSDSHTDKDTTQTLNFVNSLREENADVSFAKSNIGGAGRKDLSYLGRARINTAPAGHKAV